MSTLKQSQDALVGALTNLKSQMHTQNKSTAAGHTAGPWFVNGPWHIQADTKTEIPVIVADIIGLRSGNLAEREANARLIAAAPGLLEALEEILRVEDMERSKDADKYGKGFLQKPFVWEAQARAAIARAKGQ